MRTLTWPAWADGSRPGTAEPSEWALVQKGEDMLPPRALEQGGRCANCGPSLRRPGGRNSMERTPRPRHPGALALADSPSGTVPVSAVRGGACGLKCGGAPNTRGRGDIVGDSEWAQPKLRGRDPNISRCRGG